MSNAASTRLQDLEASLKACLLSDQINGWPGTSLHWHASYRTLRIAATRHKRWLKGSWRAQHWRADDDRGICVFTPFATFSPDTVSLVVLAKPGDPVLPGLINTYAHLFHDVVIVLDSTNEIDRTNGHVRVVSRPLRGDFASQRNVGTRATTGTWVFHLDTDETVSQEFCSALPQLAQAAGISGYLAVGFPRRNIVNGQLSDLFPDIQHRLIRRDISFRGHVHERPSVCDEGDRAIVSQHGVIDHRLDIVRVHQRSKLYDQLGQDLIRHADDQALLTPFEP